jgi:hypothetical protein
MYRLIVKACPQEAACIGGVRLGPRMSFKMRYSFYWDVTQSLLLNCLTIDDGADGLSRNVGT